MDSAADDTATIGRPTRVMAAGLLAVTFAFVPGMASPFLIGKEALVALVTAFTLVVVAADGADRCPAWPAWWIAFPAAAVVIAFGSLIANGADLLASNGAVRVLLYGSYMLALRFACPNATAAGWLGAVIVIAAAVEGVVVVMQVGFGHLVLDTAGLPSDKWKAFGTLGNPNWVGGYLAAALPLAIWRAVDGGRRSSWVAPALIGIGLGATLSRGAWVAALAALAVIGVCGRSRPRRKAGLLLPVAAVVLGIGIAWVSYGSSGVRSDLARTGSIDGRIRMWQVAATMIADRPGLGWGVGRFAAVYPTYQRMFLAGRDAGPVTDVTDHPHNEYLYWAVEAGAAGAVLAGILLWLVVAAGIRGKSRQRIVPWAAGLAAVSVHAAVDIPLHLPVNAALCCLLLAGFIASVGIDSSRRSHLSRRWRAALLMVALIVLVQAVRLTVVDRALRVSRQALAAGDPAIAARVAEEGLWFEPASGELLTTLARAQMAAGQSAAALAIAHRAAAIQPSATLSYLMAGLEAERGNLVEAEHHLRRLSQTLPGLLLPRIRLAEIYSRQGEMERAKDELRSGLAQPAKISSLRQMRLRERASAQLREMEVADVR